MNGESMMRRKSIVEYRKVTGRYIIYGIQNGRVLEMIDGEGALKLALINRLQ
jgi:hypothetical protein